MNPTPLSRGQRLGYGVGDFGINLFFISALTYLGYFYTDVFGLTAQTAAKVFLVARLIDAVTDPVMGWLLDRTRSRWGNMRPYLLFGAPPMGLLLILTFSVPDLGEGGKVIYAYATYILFGIAYTAVAVPYSSLTARLSKDYDERTRLSTVRMACAFTGGFVVSVATPRLVGLAEDEAAGYFNTMVLYAVIAIAALWITFVKTGFVVAPKTVSATAAIVREGHDGIDDDQSSHLPHVPHLPLRHYLRTVFANVPLWAVIGIFCCGMLGFTVRSAATPYYFKYFVERPDLISTYFAVTLGAMLVGLIAVPRLADRFGKIKSLYAGALLTILGLLALYAAAPTDIVWIFVAGSVAALGATPIAVLGWALIPDTVDYAQWRHGVRADGLIYAVSSFVQKLAKALGGAGVLFILGYFGYIANTAPTAESLAAIVALMSWLPALLLLPLVIFGSAHRLDEASHRHIVAELAAGRYADDEGGLPITPSSVSSR